MKNTNAVNVRQLKITKQSICVRESKLSGCDDEFETFWVVEGKIGVEHFEIAFKNESSARRLLQLIEYGQRYEGLLK